MYCEGAKKAIIHFTDKNGSERKAEINSNLPITTACSDTPRTGKYIFTVSASGYLFPTCNSTGGYEYNSEHIADSYQIIGTLDHPYNETHGFSCQFYNIDFYIGFEKVDSASVSNDYTISQANNPNYSSGEKELVIFNNLDSEIYRFKVKDCEHQISCDDNCPDGQMKCSCDKYPGYCCISCSDIVSKIKNLASRLKNNG